MKDQIRLTGMVLFAAPVGEYDKRLVILTKERGKITAFARGAKRNSSLLRAASNPFAFGTFIVTETRDAYNLYGVEISRYFTEISQDVENACYASYFSEFADYYGREGIESGGMLLLLYVALRQLIAGKIPKKLVRRVYELKLMVLNGEYTERPPRPCGDSASYAWNLVATAPVAKVYSFLLQDAALEEFCAAVQVNVQNFTDRRFRSLEVLEAVAGE